MFASHVHVQLIMGSSKKSPNKNLPRFSRLPPRSRSNSTNDDCSVGKAAAVKKCQRFWREKCHGSRKLREQVDSCRFFFFFWRKMVWKSAKIVGTCWEECMNDNMEICLNDYQTWIEFWFKWTLWSYCNLFLSSFFPIPTPKLDLETQNLDVVWRGHRIWLRWFGPSNIWLEFIHFLGE